jgi:pimeloyl-ACP methyl ester carboxylesterase
MTVDDYAAQLRLLERYLLLTLEAFEAEFEELRFGELGASRERLRAALDPLIPATRRGLMALEPPPARADFHRQLIAAATRCEDAAQSWLQGRGATFVNNLVQCRQLLVQTLEQLYPLRGQLPVLGEYFGRAPAPAAAGTGAGLIAWESCDDHEACALYVPDTYAPERDWPLIVALHGASGSGREYLWTWQRPAAERGYLVLAPSSADITWSVLQPPVDIASVTGALDRVLAAYRVDRRRIYLTGLSDGATFSYLLAFLAPEYFAGVAPIAGELSQVAEPLLRRREGREVPLLVVHGAQDHIFPIQTVRSTSDLLRHLGYDIRFEELPDWGHAYPYRIHRELVLPWFEELAARAPGG